MAAKIVFRAVHEPVLLARAACQEPQLYRAGNTLISIYTHPAPNKDTDNEDCIAIIPFAEDGVIIAVADGVGGLPAGAAASETALKVITACIRQAASSREGIMEGIEQANQAILDSGSNSATTLMLVEIDGYSARTWHVGDSGMLLTGQRARLKAETNPHSPTGDGVRGGFLNELDALQHAERNIVSNVLGSQEMHMEIGSPTTIATRDTGIVASDGLFDNLLVREIVDIIRTGTLQKATRTLVDFAARRMLNSGDGIIGHPDDLSVALFRKTAP